MIITSKFHDYYDTVISPTDRDPKITYLRETKQIGKDKVPKHELGAFLRGVQVIRGDDPSRYVGIILLCGKIYPFGVTHTHSSGYTFDYKDPYKHFPKETKYRFGKPQQEAPWGQEHPDVLRLNRDLAPVISLLPQIILIPGRANYYGMTLNPQLKLLAFPMHVNEVVTQLMGFLAIQDPNIVATTDAARAQAHGMDKTSFRRDKGGPTRKRKELTH